MHTFMYQYIQTAGSTFGLLSKQNLSVPSLHFEIVTRIFEVWGTPTMDMFATVHNIRLLQFMSLILEPLALAVGALSQDWQGRSLYMFPPFPLINKVIQKLLAIQEEKVIPIVPWLPLQP